MLNIAIISLVSEGFETRITRIVNTILDANIEYLKTMFTSGELITIGN